LPQPCSKSRVADRDRPSVSKSSVPTFTHLSPRDPKLTYLLDRWHSLPAHIQAAIITLVKSVADVSHTIRSEITTASDPKKKEVHA
jgi:hypothetical protein